jgi:hypothetical protein
MAALQHRTMTTPRDAVAALVAKIKVENGPEVINEAFIGLITVLHDDPTDIVARKAIAEADGIQATIKVMKHFSQPENESMPIQAFGCTILAAVSVVSHGCKRDICNGGGIPLAVAALENYMHESIPRQQGLQVLEKAMGIDPDSVAEALPIILRAMETHVDDAITQQCVCSILTGLTHSSEKSEEYKRALVREECAHVLVATVKYAVETNDTEWTASCVPDINMGQAIASSALIVFTSMIRIDRDSTLDSFAECGGIQALTSTMSKWPSFTKMQSHNFHLLSEFVTVDRRDSTFEAMLEAGGMPVVVDVMRNWLDDKSTGCRMAAQATWIMIVGGLSMIQDDSVATLRRSGAISVIVDILLEQHANGPPVSKSQLHFSFLYFLSSWIHTAAKSGDDEASVCISEVIACGGIAAVVASMEEFPDYAALQGKGCKVLATLALDECGNATAVVVDGGRRVLEEAKRKHGDVEEVQTWATAALACLESEEDMDRCHKCHATSETLLQCGRCKKVFYCNRECQRSDYKTHRRCCKLLANRRSGRVE